MAVESTTDSTQTTEAPGESQETDSSSQTTQTTEENSSSEETSEPSAKTILTDDSEDNGEAAKTVSADETDEQKAAREASEALHGAPEGDYELTLPKGVTVDTEALALVAPVAKELNLSNEGLSKIASVYAESVLPGVVAQVNKDLGARIDAQAAAWALGSQQSVEGATLEDGTVVAPDPVFEGKKFSEVKQIAAKALDRFGGTEFRKYLDESGLGNHKAMLRTMFMAGAAISEDTSFERGQQPPPGPKSKAELYYGKSA